MSLYTPVKYALMILLALGIIFVIINLLPELQRQRSNVNNIVIMVLELLILLIGFFGAYRGSRQLLLTFVIIMVVLIIFSIVQSQAVNIIGNAVLNFITVLLAAWMSEMIRTRDF